MRRDSFQACLQLPVHNAGLFEQESKYHRLEIMVKVAVTLRVIENQNYSEKRDAISHDWIGFLEKRNICPVLIPNAISSPLSFLSALGNIDGVLLTSGNA